MSNQVSAQLLAQLFGQVSNDPFLMLVTLSHSSFSTIRLVNNTVDITSRGQTYSAFPMEITLASDDGESAREVRITFDNVSLELIDELRSVTTSIDVKVEMALASTPNVIELSIEELKLRSITYNKNSVSAVLYMDSFLNTEMDAEKYLPSIYPGLF